MVFIWYLYGIYMVFIWYLNGIYIGAIAENLRGLSLCTSL